MIVDAGEPFVKATYRFDGDGPLGLECYEILSSVNAAVEVCHLPNTFAIAKRLASTTFPENIGRDMQGHAYIQPGYDYFWSKFDQDLRVDAFKAVRLFNHSKVNDLKPDCSSIDTLRSFKVLESDNLKSELPTYLAISVADVDPLTCWEQNTERVPPWAKEESHSLSAVF